MAAVALVVGLLFECALVAFSRSVDQEFSGKCYPDSITPVSNFNTDRIQGVWYVRKIYTRQAPQVFSDVIASIECASEEIRKTSKFLESNNVPFYIREEARINFEHLMETESGNMVKQDRRNYNRSMEKVFQLVVTPKGVNQGIWNVFQFSNLEQLFEDEATVVYVDTDYDDWALKYECGTLLSNTFFVDTMVLLTRGREGKLDTKYTTDLEKKFAEKYKFPVDKSYIINQTKC